AVNPSRLLRARIAQLSVPIETLRDRPSFVPTLLRAMRVRQWVKNLLLFLPIVAAHTIAKSGALGRAAVAALAFCFISSSVYLMNDLFDVEADRQHPTKRNRPLAAGDLSIAAAVTTIPIALLAAFSLGAFVSMTFVAILATYLVVNIVYTMRLKQIMGVDVIVLALLYSLRVFAGGVATDTPISTWFVAFTTFFFFALAILKRYIEVRLHERRHVAGRGYVA